MSVAIVLTRPEDVRLVHWAARIAEGRQKGLVLFWTTKRPRKSDNNRTSSRYGDEIPDELAEICHELDEGSFRYRREEKPTDKETKKTATKDPDVTRRDDDLAKDDQDDMLLEVVCIASKQIQHDLEQEVDDLDISCLIIPREPQTRSDSPEADVINHLLGNVPCEIVLLTPGSSESGQCTGIVTPVGGGPHSASCLRMANDMAKVSDAKLVALHVEPHLDVTSQQAAQRILKRTVDRALGSDQRHVKKRVVLNNNVLEGIKETLDESPDLLIIGMRRTGLVQRFSSQGIGGRLVNSNPGPAVAIVQSAMPLSSRLGRRVDELLQGTIPQLPRDKRVDLVERIQSSSQWDFDFVALIFMSTLIAAGGLIQDSAAVVIGAMLVAPLMTPLLGSGLAITQGNFLLLQSTLATVLRGFLLAFVTSFVVGMLAADGLTDEMIARGSPRVLDILVAAVGGMAAAYATGRPNLLSALPGVAIAASLVPPIATSGIALYLGDVGLSLRSALLFFTNIVAIVLGTWIAFLAVGIRSAHQHGDFNRWTKGAVAALLALVVILGIYESRPKRQRVEGIVQSQLNKLAEKDQWSCSDAEYQYVDGRRVLNVYLESTDVMSPERLNSIRKAVTESFETPPPIKFTTAIMQPE